MMGTSTRKTAQRRPQPSSQHLKAHKEKIGLRGVYQWFQQEAPQAASWIEE